MNDASQPWATPIHAIWFDLDGTLLDSHPKKLHLHFIWSFTKKMRPLLPIHRSLILLHRLRKAVERRDQNTFNVDRAIQVFAQELKLSTEEASQYFHKFAVEIFHHLRFCFEPTPGAKAGMGLLPSTTPLYLVTNPAWPLDVVSLRLAWAGIAKAKFQTITHGGNMTTTKEDPSFYQKVLSLTGLNPENTLFVGDNARKDLAAIESGCRVFLLNNPHYAQRNKNAVAQLPASKQSLCRQGNWTDLSRFFTQEAQWN